MFTKSLRIGLIGLLVFAANTFASPSTVEGTVNDASGRALKGADVQIEGNKFSKTVKTDAAGHYASGNLSAGAYRVIVLVNGAAKATMNVKVTSGTTQLNFNLDNVGLASGSGKGKHKVWVEGKTGSNMGGHWIEVDDDYSGNATTRASDRPH